MTKINTPTIDNNSSSVDNKMSLIEAIATGKDAEALKLIQQLTKEDLDAFVHYPQFDSQDKKCFLSPLYLAVINGNLTIVKELLQKGVNADAVHHEGAQRTTLMAAVCYNDSFDIAGYLLAYGSNANKGDINGKTVYDFKPEYKIILDTQIRLILLADHVFKGNMIKLPLNVAKDIKKWGDNSFAPRLAYLKQQESKNFDVEMTAKGFTESVKKVVEAEKPISFTLANNYGYIDFHEIVPIATEESHLSGETKGWSDYCSLM